MRRDGAEARAHENRKRSDEKGDSEREKFREKNMIREYAFGIQHSLMWMLNNCRMESGNVPCIPKVQLMPN